MNRFQPTLLQRFALIGLLTSVLLASFTGLVASRYLAARELQEFTDDATDLVSHLITPMIDADFFGAPSPRTMALWTEGLNHLIGVADIDRVKVWSSDRILIFASNRGAIGQRFDSPLLERALEGEIVAARVDAVAPDHSDEVGEDLYEIYVPVALPGASRPIGVYEIYMEYAPIRRQLRRIALFTYLASFFFFGLLFVSLLMALAASRRQHMAFRDPLTGLANRYRFNEVVGRLLGGRGSCSAALLYLDVARFQTVNDSLGHSAGDDILRQIADRLRGVVRPRDTVSRLGGDEFGLLLVDLDPAEGAEGVADRIRRAFEAPFTHRHLVLHLDAVMGIAPLDRGPLTSSPPFGVAGAAPGQAPLTVEVWLQQADTARVHAKAQGRPFAVYDPEMATRALERLQLEEHLRRGIERDQLVLHFQPICGRGGAVVGAEALVRWQHPERGVVSPAAFIPVAEETGLIRRIDRWVVRRAVRQLAIWLEAGKPIKIAVNLSPQTFQDPDFADWLGAVLDEEQVPPTLLTLEITEYVLADADRSRRSLEALAAHGVEVALDDFGKGYSSLAYLESLPIGRIKIDRQFIDGIGRRATSEAIVKTIIALTANLGIESVGEGIETEAQLAWLEAEGCKLFQGFLLGRPVPVEAFPLGAVGRGEEECRPDDRHLLAPRNGGVAARDRSEGPSR